MTLPFADALTWMPKSRALGATLTRAHDIARAQGHAGVLLEHLLQALIEDPDASAVLLSCNIDLLNLNAAVATHLQGQPVSGSSQPEASPNLLQILEYAAAAARQSKRSEVNGAIVLAAMAGEGKSDAARMLKGAGLKFEDTIQALRKSAPARPTATSAPPPPTPPASLTLNAPGIAAAAPAQPISAGSLAAPSAAHDEDPLTTARRRVAALRIGNGATAPAASSPSFNAVASASAALAMAQPAQTANPADAQPWAPSPPPLPPASNVRPMRMPPPVPAVPVRPPQSKPVAGKPPLQLRAPWSPASGELPEANQTTLSLQQSTSRITGEPIDPARLGEGFPSKMHERVPSTVEVRISRAAVLATAAAMRAGARDNYDTALTRAVSVRVRAPAGGFHVDTAVPETQWFDNRQAYREDDEVRWRWVVTPQISGTKPLLVAVTMRTIASDGTVIDTALPEHQFNVRVGSNYREGLRRVGRAAIAVSVGAVFTLLATGGFASVFGWIGN